MLKNYIEKYVKKLDINDFSNFAFKNNILLNTNELTLLYDYTKKYWETIIYSDQYIILSKIENKINYKAYKQIEELILIYKEKYNKYL